MTVDRETRWVRPSGVLWRRTTTGVALLPPGSDEPLFLTGTAALLWDLVTASHTLAETAATLAERYGVTPATVTTDVAPLLEELVGRGVLVPDGGVP